MYLSVHSLHDVFHNTAELNGNTSYPELAADGIIMDLAYSPERFVLH
jgi:hypothetical protein